MKPYLLLFLMALFIPLRGLSQTFQAYYQQNHRWNGSKFVEADPAITSTTFTFNKDQLVIDKSKFTLVNRIANSSGEYMTARSNEDSSITVSIVMEMKTDAKGRKFKCLTIERPKAYKIIYYLN